MRIALVELALSIRRDHVVGRCGHSRQIRYLAWVVPKPPKRGDDGDRIVLLGHVISWAVSASSSSKYRNMTSALITPSRITASFSSVTSTTVEPREGPRSPESTMRSTLSLKYLFKF